MAEPAENQTRKGTVPMRGARKKISLYKRRKQMNTQHLSSRKKNSVLCQRCNGPMSFEKFYADNDGFFAWRCLLCGDILDSVILLHRLSQDAQLEIPEREEERISLIRKYTGNRSKAMGAGKDRA
jgi:hypothetical protein